VCVSVCVEFNVKRCHEPSLSPLATKTGTCELHTIVTCSVGTGRRSNSSLPSSRYAI